MMRVRAFVPLSVGAAHCPRCGEPYRGPGADCRCTNDGRHTSVLRYRLAVRTSELRSRLRVWWHRTTCRLCLRNH